MLINFSVQNFGSIKDKQILSFEADKSNHLEDYYVINANGIRLLKLGLIFGANASGKTTLLKSLDFLRFLILNPKDKKTETLNFEPFKFDERTPSQNTFFEIEFLQNDMRYFYQVELNRETVVNENLYCYSPKKSQVFSRTTDLKSQATNIKFGNKFKINETTKKNLEQITLWNNTVVGAFLKINFISKELKDITDWFKDYLQELILPNAPIKELVWIGDIIPDVEKQTIIDILKKADFNISNFHIRETENSMDFITQLLKVPKYEIADWDSKIIGGLMKSETPQDFKFSTLDIEHTVKGKKYRLDFDVESQGTQRYYAFAYHLSKLINNSILLPIDELESSLHPDLFQHFLLSFIVNSKKSQIIATTHSREILNNKDIFRNDAIWITDKDNENYSTELYSLADFDTKVIRDTTNILNVYKLGKLGGVPNLGDYYIDIENDEKK